MQGTTLQEKMAGNLRDYNLAFQAGEAALRDAERYLFNTASLPSFSDSCTNGFCTPSVPTNAPKWKMLNTSNVSYWYDTATIRTRSYGTSTGASNLPTVSRQPQTMLEELIIAPLDPSDPPIMRYRITSQGYGAAFTTDSGVVKPHARVMLQTIVQR